jgi:hypothetical protein
VADGAAWYWPRFDEPTRLDGDPSAAPSGGSGGESGGESGGGSAWTAEFESYNQRTDDVYYVVTVLDGAGPPVRFMANVVPPPGDDWTGPAFAEGLREQLHQVAAMGRTNTGYTGPLGRL